MSTFFHLDTLGKVVVLCVAAQRRRISPYYETRDQLAGLPYRTLWCLFCWNSHILRHYKLPNPWNEYNEAAGWDARDGDDSGSSPSRYILSLDPSRFCWLIHTKNTRVVYYNGNKYNHADHNVTPGTIDDQFFLLSIIIFARSSVVVVRSLFSCRDIHKRKARF